MPSQSAHTWLEIPSNPAVDAGFQRALSDSLRQIARQFDALSTGGGVRVQTKRRGGAFTVNGAELVLSMPGTLAIMSNAAPLVSLAADTTPTEIVALVKQAPLGGKIQVQLNVDGAKYGLVEIAENQTSGDVSGSSFAAIGADKLITLDVAAVGLAFPGSDLSVIVRF